MSLSIEVSTEVLEAHERVNKKHGKYAIFKADESKEKVILDCEGGLDATFEQFKESFPSDQPR